MKKLNKNDLEIVTGASQNDRDIAQLTGTLIGVGIGHVTKIPGGQAVGSAVGSYLGGLAYDNGRKTITIPPNVVIDPINNVLPWYKPTGPAFYPRF